MLPSYSFKVNTVKNNKILFVNAAACQMGPWDPTSLVGFELSRGLVSAISCLSEKPHFAKASSLGWQGKVHECGKGSSPASFSESPARCLFGLCKEPVTSLVPLRSPELWSALVSRVPGYQICSLT